MRVPLLPAVFGVLIIGAAALNQYNHDLGLKEMRFQDLLKENLALRRTIQDQPRINYLATNYGHDVRRDKTRRLLPLDSFVLPRRPLPLWIQADDALIQMIEEGDSVHVDAYRIVADTEAVYLDKPLLPGKKSDER